MHKILKLAPRNEIKMQQNYNINQKAVFLTIILRYLHFFGKLRYFEYKGFFYATPRMAVRIRLNFTSLKNALETSRIYMFE